MYWEFAFCTVFYNYNVLQLYLFHNVITFVLCSNWKVNARKLLFFIETSPNSFTFVSSSPDDVENPELYPANIYQPRSSAITVCDPGYEVEVILWD